MTACRTRALRLEPLEIRAMLSSWPLIINGITGSGSGDYPFTTGTQTDRVFRDGIASDCSATKAYPGTITDGSHTFDEYDFTNLTGASNCVQVTYQYASGTGDVFSVAYDGSFNSGNVAQNYLADGGDSVNSGSPGPQTYSFVTSFGQTFPVVMSEVGALSGTGYTLKVAYTDDLVINGSNLNDTVVFTATGVNSGSFQINGGDVYQFVNITSLHVNLGDGNDTLTINNPGGGLLAPSGGIFYDGGGQTGDALRNLGGTADSGVYTPGNAVDNGRLVHTLGGTIQDITFNGLAPTLDTVVEPTFLVNGTPADNAINYAIGRNNADTADDPARGKITIDNFEFIQFSNKTAVTIDGLAGSDEINLNNSSTPTSLTGITVNGGDPTGSDTLIVNGTAATVSVNITAQTITGAGVPINYATIEHLTVVAGASTTLSVSGTSTLEGVDYTLTPGATDDRGDIETIAVPISFIGFGPGSTLNFVGDTSDGNDELTILGTSQNDIFSVAATTGAVTYTGRTTVTQTDIDDLVIDGLDGDDQFTVTGNHPYSSLAIHGNNPSASDVLNFNGSGAGAVTANFGAQTVTETGFGSVSFTGVEVLNVNANSQNLTIQTTTGDDSLTVAPTGTNAVTAQLTASNPAIGASPLINGSNITTLNVDLLGGSDHLTVNGTQGGETITVTGAMVTVAALETVNYSNAEFLQVNALAGNDTIDVTPAAGIPIFVDGGDPIGSTPGDRIILHPPGAFVVEPGPEKDEGGLNSAGLQRVSWDHIEAITVIGPPGGGPGLTLGTNGDDDITIIARDASYDPLANGIQDFTVSVNDGPDILYIDNPVHLVDALSGDDDIVVREPAPNNAVWNVQLFIACGPPAAVTGDQGDVVELETPGSQTVSYTPSPTTFTIPPLPIGVTITVPTPGASDTAVFNDTTNTSVISITPFTLSVLALFNYTSSPGGAEQVIYDGQTGADNLTVLGTAGDDTFIHLPGSADNAGTFKINSLLGLDYENLGSGSVLTVNGLAGTNTLIADGTTANDLFQVDATTGTVHLNNRQPIVVTAIQNLRLVGLTGDDTFKLQGALPYTNVTLEGDEHSSSNILNLTGATGLVTVNLADSVVPTDTTVTGYGGTVTLIGVEVANLDANSNAMTVNGTVHDDVITYTPSGASAGTFQNAGLNTVFNFTAVTGNFLITGGVGAVGTVGVTDAVVVRGTNSRDRFLIDQGARTAQVFAFNFNALKLVNLGSNIQVLSALGLLGQDTFQVVPGAGVAAFANDFQNFNNLLINVDGGSESTGENNALVIQSAIGGTLADDQFVVVNRGALADSGTVRTFKAAVQWPDINYVNVQVVSPNVANAPAGKLNAGQPNLLIMGPDIYEPDEFQPNSAFVGSGSTLQIQHASIFPNNLEFPGVPSDDDYYRVVAQATGTLDFQVYFKLFDLTLLPDGGNLNLEVFDVNGNLIAAAPGTFGAAGTTANARVRIPAVAGQSYYLHVFGELPGEGQSQVINGYDVTIIDTPPPIPQNLELEDVVISATVAAGIGTTSFTGNAAITSPAGGTLSAVNNFYNGRYLTITSGLLTGQRVTITGYVGATRTFTVSPGFTATPTAGTAFLIESIDTGRSQNDNVIRDNTPTIFLRLDDGIFLHDLPGNPANDTPPPGDGQIITIPFQGITLLPGYRIAIFDEGSTPPQNGTAPQTPLGYAVATAQEGVYTFTTPVLTDGSHFLTARVEMIDPATPTQTGFGDRSLALEVFIDTLTPPAYFGLLNPADTTQGLDAASDSGVLGDPNLPATFTDRITNDKTPTLYGAAEADSIVRIYLNTNGVAGLQSGGANPDTYLGETVAIPLDGTNQFPNGHWSFTVTRDLNDPLLGLGIDGLRTFFITGEDPAGNVTADANADALQIFIDTAGPQITNVQITGSPGFNLFGLKADNVSQGPTPLVFSLTISVQDLPARVVEFLYNALAADATDPQNPAENPGNYLLVGDANGVIQITSVQFNPNPPVAGSPATGTLVLTFADPLPDDRFTLTVKDNVVDPAGNKLDGESNAIEPNGAPDFPSGDGQPGGDFVARFTVDSRPEIGTWSGGSEYIDTNGNFIYDPANLDATNRDLTYTLGFTSDNIFAGNFGSPYINEAGTPNGFSKLAAYGKDTNGNYRWLFLNDTADVITTIAQPPRPNGKPFNAFPVAGDFDGFAGNGDEVGLFDGTNWYFDTNNNGFIDSGDFQLAGAIRGFPIVGDFDGDGHVDLSTYHDGVFYFQLWDGANYSPAVQTFALFGTGLPQLGALTRPVAADMDQDGITDIGLYVPDGSGATGTSASEWYWFISDDFERQNPESASVFSIPNRKFAHIPLGHDIFAKFGNNYAMPIVGNFDPPLGGQSNTPSGSQSNTPTQQQTPSNGSTQTTAVKSFTLTGPTSGTYSPGQNITITWTAGGVPSNSVISLCLDKDATLWNGNEKWIEIDAVAAADGDGSYTFDPAGFTPGTYYVGGYMFDKSTKTFTNSHLTQAITVPSPTFTLTGPISGTYSSGQNITIAWTAAGVPSNSVISLCLDKDATLWNGNEKWIEIDAVAAANGNGSYTFDPTGFAPGTYYVGGYMFNKSTKTFTNSHLTQAITVPGPSFTLTGPTSGTFAAGQPLTITWTAANVPANGVISLCLDKDTKLWNGNEKWIEIDAVAASNGDKSYTFGLTDVTAGTYFVGGYMFDKSTKTFTNSHLTQPITVPAPSFTLTGPTSGTFAPGQPVTFTWTAANVPANGVISLCLDTDAKLWNGNEKWIAIDAINATNGSGSFNYDTAGITPGTYYIGGYMYDRALKTFFNSHLTKPINLTSDLIQSLSLANSNLQTAKTKETAAIDLIFQRQDTWL
jgi:hypothetical protein